MKILVAGASSVLGPPTIRELARRGHTVLGLTRDPGNAGMISANGATPVLGDVFDPDGVRTAVSEAAPDCVVSLLITLPHYGPRKLSEFEETVRLWKHGVPNLLDAAAAAGTQRVVAESVIFAYGYAHHPHERIDETFSEPMPTPPLGATWLLSALHDMERRVLEADAFSGVVLRYGAFHGPAVPSTRLLQRLMSWRVPVVPGEGRAVLSWIEISDAARATADAVEHAQPGHMYNVVDDRPVTFDDYTAWLARALDLPAPRGVPRWLARMALPYLTMLLDDIRLPVSNRKAKRQLGWSPRYPTVEETAHLLARDLGMNRSRHV